MDLEGAVQFKVRIVMAVKITHIIPSIMSGDPLQLNVMIGGLTGLQLLTRSGRLLRAIRP